MLTGRKYRLKLTAEQEAMCEEFGNACRAVWNTGLEQRREYRRRGAWMNYVPQCAELTDARREYEWLRAAPSHILQQALKDLDLACRTHGSFKVRWRSKARWSPSFRFPDGGKIRVERLSRKWGRAKLPKMGWVTFRWTRHLGGQVRSATVSRRAGHWYVSFLVNDGLLTPEHHAGTPVGIDRGVVVAATTSAGDFHDRQFATAGEKIRYRRLQQRLARTSKGSANRRKTRAAMARSMSRVANRRADFCTQIASQLTIRHNVVVLEDLRIRNMTASAKGNKEAPGQKVRQKAGLNRAIRDKGWHRLEQALRNAARYSGTQVVLVNPAYTSQTCNRCRHVDAKSRNSQAVFVCTACGHRDNADINAAKNVLCAAGHAVPACGDLAVGRSVKQEPSAPRGTPSQPALSLSGIPEPRAREEANLTSQAAT
ncbi:RNA-guided endonuclease InsQ/TnpB family protein [Streptomyces scabiei]|uniref:RNA-guided endonuclease InsQ/TnpB family protein n=1 Tax=Streptomyces scabiei TaxID=1930 RepID=UPI0029AC503A|nr:transposase [Streptomyces scabiei]MDX3027517.1 transposase [Streptomyces scabiei]